MGIEEIMLGNTEALIKLTEALNRFPVNTFTEPKAAKAPKEVKKAEEVQPVEKEIKAAVKAPEEITFAMGKAMINKLALNHREDIKALNRKYGLAVYPDLLADRNNADGGVNDQEKLNNYYADLLKIAALEGTEA